MQGILEKERGGRSRPAILESTPDIKIVPRFCIDVIQIAKDSPHVSFSEFIDRAGFRWHCFQPMTCDHAIVMHGAMISCRLRTAMLNESEKAGAS